jgi:hypothetical protein
MIKDIQDALLAYARRNYESTEIIDYFIQKQEPSRQGTMIKKKADEEELCELEFI